MLSRKRIVSALASSAFSTAPVQGDEPGLSRAEFDRLQRVLSLKNQLMSSMRGKRR
jgi:hypothetical protein